MATTLSLTGTVTTVLRSDELSCPSCVPKIERALERLAGVARARVRFAAGRIEVQHDPQQVTTDALVRAVRRVGYEAHLSVF